MLLSDILRKIGDKAHVQKLLKRPVEDGGKPSVLHLEDDIGAVISSGDTIIAGV